MKTLLATLVGLGMLAGTANAQHVRFIGHGYTTGPEICAPGVIHQFQRGVMIAPKIVQAVPGQQAEAPAEAEPEAPAEAAPEAPAENAAPLAPLQAPLPPK